MIVHCATTNKGKLREFQAAAGIVRIEPLAGMEAIAAPEETGSTFEENAAQKAIYYSRFTNEYLFAEDSGLSVNALRGAPSVFSARYAGLTATDDDNNRLLLQEMRGIADRSARYICVIALARAGYVVETFRGEVEGSIAEHPRGTNGFGYDPLFFYPPFGCTFGEAPPERKQSVSHRGAALRLLLAFLERLAREQS